MYILKKTKFSDFFSFAVLVTAFVVFVLFGCEKVEKPVYDNPIDPLNKNFVLPQATITNSFNQGSVLSETTITFLWNGVNPNSSYSYMLEGIDDTYSAWQAGVNTVTYSYLDEGYYTFFVKEGYNSEIVQETPDSLAFTIDAVTVAYRQNIEASRTVDLQLIDADTATVYITSTNTEITSGLHFFSSFSIINPFPNVDTAVEIQIKDDGSQVSDASANIYFTRTP